MPPPISCLPFNDAAGASIRSRLTQEGKNSHLQKCLYWNVRCISSSIKTIKNRFDISNIFFFSVLGQTGDSRDTRSWNRAFPHHQKNPLQTEPEYRPEKVRISVLNSSSELKSKITSTNCFNRFWGEEGRGGGKWRRQTFRKVLENVCVTRQKNLRMNIHFSATRLIMNSDGHQKETWHDHFINITVIRSYSWLYYKFTFRPKLLSKHQASEVEPICYFVDEMRAQSSGKNERVMILLGITHFHSGLHMMDKSFPKRSVIYTCWLTILDTSQYILSGSEQISSMEILRKNYRSTLSCGRMLRLRSLLV